MAFSAPSGFDVAQLRDAIHATYEAVARDPSGHFHFHRGRSYAVEHLGYGADELDALPDLATARFAGVGNPLRIGPIESGETENTIMLGGVEASRVMLGVLSGARAGAPAPPCPSNRGQPCRTYEPASNGG